MLVRRRDPPGAGPCPAGAAGPGPPTVLAGAGERLSLGDEEPIQALMSTSATDSSGTSARRRPGPIPPTTSPGWSRLPNRPEAPSAGFSARPLVAAIRLRRHGQRFIAAATAGIDGRPRSRGEPFSLRWIIPHMIEEYARHNGHAGLIRESIDESTGE